jgi:hypothetical protein
LSSLGLPCFLSRAVWIFWEEDFKQAGDMDNESFCVCFGLNFFVEFSSIRYYSSYRFILSGLARSFWLGLTYVCCSLPDPSVGMRNVRQSHQGVPIPCSFFCIQRA